MKKNHLDIYSSAVSKAHVKYATGKEVHLSYDGFESIKALKIHIKNLEEKAINYVLEQAKTPTFEEMYKDIINIYSSSFHKHFKKYQKGSILHPDITIVNENLSPVRFMTLSEADREYLVSCSEIIYESVERFRIAVNHLGAIGSKREHFTTTLNCADVIELAVLLLKSGKIDFHTKNKNLIDLCDCICFALNAPIVNNANAEKAGVFARKDQTSLIYNLFTTRQKVIDDIKTKKKEKKKIRK